MAARLAVHVVCIIMRAGHAWLAIEISEIEPGDNRHTAPEHATQLSARQIGKAQTAAALQEFAIAVDRELELGIATARGARAQLGGDVDVGIGEPGRIEEIEIEGVDGRIEAALQRVNGEMDFKGTALLQRGDRIDDLGQCDIEPVKTIQGMQTGRPAGHAVRLRFDVYR